MKLIGEIFEIPGIVAHAFHGGHDLYTLNDSQKQAECSGSIEESVKAPRTKVARSTSPGVIAI